MNSTPILLPIRRGILPTLVCGAALSAALYCPLAAQIAETDDSSDEIVQLDPFEIVTDKGTKGYASSNALGGTRINTLLENTPVNIATLNRKVLEDINPTSLADAFRFVSGVSVAEGAYSGKISIRGQQINATGNRDGLSEPLDAAHGTTLPDPIEVERLEVIKGPAGVLYGSHNFGGVLNRVSKRPREEQRTVIGTEYLTYGDGDDSYRMTLDSTGPLDTEKKWLYRVLAAVQEGDQHMHDTFNRSTYIGELRFRPAAETALWARFRYSDDHISVQQDMWTDAGLNMPFGYIPQRPYIGNFWQDDQVDSTLATNLELGWTQEFSIGGQRFDLKAQANRGEVTGQRRTYISLGGLFYKDGTPLRNGAGTALTTRNANYADARSLGYDDIRENINRRDIRNGNGENTSINIDLTTEFDLGPTSHRMLSYFGSSWGDSFQRRFRESYVAAERPSIYQRFSVDPTTILDGNPSTRANEWIMSETDALDDWSWAIVDNVRMFNDRIALSGGFRYDTSEGGMNTNFGTSAAPNTVVTPGDAVSNWTPTYGAVFKPVKGVSLFAQHSETFQPQGGVNQNGDTLAPLIGDNNEVGVKFDLMGGRMVSTISYFDSVQENAPQKLIDNNGNFIFVDTADIETTGWEADLAMEPFPGLTFLVALQDIDSEDTKTNRRIRSVPQGFTYKGMASYRFNEDGALGGLTVGANYEHINDSRYGDSGNNFQMPGYDLVGVFASYGYRDWKLQLNVDNLTDEWYVAGSTASLFMRSGLPRTVKLRVSYSF